MSWADDAACAGMDPAIFLDVSYEKQALAVCGGCTVQEPCLAEARKLNARGTWGGTTEKERGVW